MTAAGRQVAQFRDLLAARLGWAFADNDVPHLQQELDRRADAHGLARSAYLVRLSGGWPEELAVIAEHLSITETYFFRHGEQFRALAEVALPERLAARSSRRALRMLSVGCSSGEEAYTLAIVARVAQPDPDWVVSVTGVDANPAMLRKAAAGCYSAWSLRETPDDVRHRWFRRHDGTYEVDAAIRRAVRWQRYNVADEHPALWAAEQYDVIFCRNLLMYLTPAVASGLVERMTRALAPGGYLFLGHTDSLGSRPAGLDPQHTRSTFFYRRPVTPIPAPPRTPHAEPSPSFVSPAPAPPPDAGDQRVLALIHEERFAEALAVVEQVIAHRPHPREQLLHGVLLAHAGRLEDAEMVARRLLDQDGLDADAHHLLGVCLEGGAAVDVAIGHYRLAAYLDPAFAMPRLRLGLLGRRRGDHRAAGTDLDRALHLLREERDDRIVLFGGGFGRIALTGLCRSELDACGVRR